MNFKKKILVFPCGSEIGLEIHRSLRYVSHIDLIGANSIDDHGRYIYKKYIGGVPFFNAPNFLSAIKKIIKDNKIDAIFPAMDSVISVLKLHEHILGCKVIASPIDTVQICNSKRKTYNHFKGIVRVPAEFDATDRIIHFPVFLKPDIGYGSRGVLKAESLEQVNSHLAKYPNALIIEYLPGKEYTVDCFSDKSGQLLFVGPRERLRVTNGISVNTSTNCRKGDFVDFASKISKSLKFEGAWFFQVKRDSMGDLVLMEIASRLGGSSSANRMKGINFALLSVYITFGLDVEILKNSYEVEIDRSLDFCFNLNLNFNYVYVDFDDTIIVNDEINVELIRFIYMCINHNKKIILITRHKKDLNDSLSKYRLSMIFDEIHHLKEGQKKSDYINNTLSIFIDDSFSERLEVQRNKQIPVLSPDIISNLIF